MRRRGDSRRPVGTRDSATLLHAGAKVSRTSGPEYATPLVRVKMALRGVWD